MAKLTRYDYDPHYGPFHGMVEEEDGKYYRADEVDKHIAQLEKENAELKEEGRRELGSAISAGWSEADAHYMPQIEQLQHDLDAAYAALWDAGPFYDDHEEMQWRTENEAILKKAHDAIIQKAKKAKEAKDGTV